MTNEQIQDAQDAAVTGLPLDENSGLKGHSDFHQLNEVALAAADAARDYRSSMAEHMKVEINAALDYANGLASASMPPGFIVTAASQSPEQQKKGDIPNPERQFLAPIKAAKEYRAKAFELVTANVNVTLDYAQRLANIRSPVEFIELSTSHARKHFELIMTYAAALGMLSQSLAASSADRMTVSIAKVFSRQRA